MKLLESYLNKIQEKEVIYEGFWESIKKFFASSQPKDLEWNRIYDEYEDQSNFCDSRFNHSNTSIQIGNLDINYYQEHPEYSLCMLKAEVQFYEEIVKLYKKRNVEDICKTHKYPDKCSKYLTKEIPKAIAEFNVLKKNYDFLVSQAKRGKKEISVNTLNKVLASLKK